MIRTKQHLEVINKFFHKLEKLNEEIDNLGKPEDDEEFNDERYILLQRYMNMMDIWMMMDDYLEKIDNQIDIALQEKTELFEKYRKKIK